MRLSLYLITFLGAQLLGRYSVSAMLRNKRMPLKGNQPRERQEPLRVGRYLQDGFDVRKKNDNNKKCKAGKDETCAPSAAPSEEPTPSPSMAPTAAPTPSPSATPSFEPTKSPQPSSAPSHAPTPAPTSTPSARPSLSQMPSYAPSATPSAMPSMPSAMPSGSPSVAPSSLPSDVPSQLPSSSPSAMPSLAPSKAPSSAPSSEPTATPSLSPSVAPSSEPSLSYQPTALVSSSPSVAPSLTPSAPPSESLMPTQSIVSKSFDGAEQTTSCISLPPPSFGTRRSGTISYQFHLLVVDTTGEDKAQQVVTDLEGTIHDALVKYFMDCEYDYSDGSTFDVIAITSGGGDEVDDACPDIIPSPGQACYLVKARVKPEVYFPPGQRRRLTITKEVLDAITVFLDDFLSTLTGEGFDSIDFQGLLNVDFDGRETAGEQGDGADVNGFIDADLAPGRGSPNLALGTGVIVAAAVILLIVAFMMVRRGRRRREAYLKHLEDGGSEGSGDLGFESKYEARYIVDENESFEKSFGKFELENEQNHDYLNCASATCRLCRERQAKPIFITANMQKQIQHDLGPKKYKSQQELFQDTVNL